jgi:hypothetical protein
MAGPQCVASNQTDTAVLLANNGPSGTTTETVIGPTYSLATEATSIGSTFRIEIFGSVDNRASADTVTWRIRWGGTSGTQLASIVTTNPASGQTNKPFHLVAIVTIRTTGATGTAYTGMRLRQDSVTTATPAANDTVADPNASVTIDTTAAVDLVATAKYSNGNAANIVRACVGTITPIRV